MSDFEAYKSGHGPIPDTQLIWPLYGAGWDNLGRNDGPIEAPVPEPEPDQLLVRHDATGLCFSDIKIIKAGPTHPRLVGRDMEKNPVVQGHEVSLTVVKVGEEWQDEYSVGDRFAVQADIYNDGVSTAYGYRIQGGLSQYGAIGREVLDADEGCYLLPIWPEAGYAETGLTEPWACVEAAYVIPSRSTVKPGGTVWIVGLNGADYVLDGEFNPSRVIATDVPADMLVTLEDSSSTRGFELVGASFLPPDGAKERYTGGGGFDDIILLGHPEPSLLEGAANALARDGYLNLVSREPVGAVVNLDVGRIHYDGWRYVGTAGSDVLAAYESNQRSELKPSGKLWVLGAGGPMGQMHVQRALDSPEKPSLIVATNLRTNRIDVVENLTSDAEKHGIEMVCLTRQELGPQRYFERLRDLAGADGFDDIIVVAASADAITEAVPFLAKDGVFNIFAGLPRGTTAPIDLSNVALRNARFIGSSGSKIADMQRVLDKVRDRQLTTRRSVAAISGMAGAGDGLRGVAEGCFAGKAIVFPQIPDLGLTPLSELKHALPNVYAKLEDGRYWTNEAEVELLRTVVP
ncbi:MAG: Mannitol-1-phosphate 5-dehydrogenase [Anaerolineales bacterium]|nr:Mannitol-1-phosphate 5-dehydrogenase [Anaerolineales bacterium]